MRLVVRMAADFYRHLLHAASGAPQPDDAELRDWVDRALPNWPGDELAAAACLERCLDAAEQIDRNANPTTLVECWLDDLSKITATGRATAH